MVKDLIPRRGSRAPVVSRDSDSVHPLLSLHEELNRLFDGLWRELEADGFWPAPLSPGFPRIEVSETDHEILVEAELPGLDEKDIELLIDDNMLTIRGEKRPEGRDLRRRVNERFHGFFERRIALPVQIQEDKISASFQKGVLTVTLPKSALAEQKVKRIPINTK